MPGRNETDKKGGPQIAAHRRIGNSEEPREIGNIEQRSGSRRQESQDPRKLGEALDALRKVAHVSLEDRGDV